MTDLDREIEALRREARRKLDEQSELAPPAPEAPPAPAVDSPSSRPADDGRASRDAELRARALGLAARALAEGPEAMVEGARLARKARRLSLLQKLSIGVGGLVALVALWNLVFAPLIRLAILIGIVAIVFLLFSKLLGRGSKDAPVRDDDDRDDED